MGLKVLSLFDGISCGMMALEKCGIEVDRYVAYEVDEYPIKASKYNYPQIEHKGDVFNATYQIGEFDILIGGSPCTHWTIANKKDRQTSPTGLGWELFMQYKRALDEVEPKFFLYENNKSMSKGIKAAISETFGFEPTLINSDAFSAQNRQRYYWVGVKTDDGYVKLDIGNIESKNITIEDILDCDDFSIGKPTRIPSYGNLNKARPCEALYSNHTGTGYGSIKQRLFSDNKCKQQNDIVAVPISKDTYLSLLGEKTVYIVDGGCLIFENEKNTIDLQDGYYLFRRLSVDEYKKLQTIPESYDISVLSNTKAYHGIGNGWTVDVIAYFFSVIKLYIESK